MKRNQLNLKLRWTIAMNPSGTGQNPIINFEILCNHWSFKNGDISFGGMYNRHTVNCKYLKCKIWYVLTHKYIYEHHPIVRIMSVYLHGCTGSSLPPAPPGPRPQVRIKSAPGGSFWDQQPHKVFSFPLMAEAQEAAPSRAGSFRTPCFIAANIPVAKTSHVAQPKIKVVGKCTLAPLGGVLHNHMAKDVEA